MKLKLIMGLIGVLSLSSFSTLPSSDDIDKQPQAMCRSMKKKKRN